MMEMVRRERARFTHHFGIGGKSKEETTKAEDMADETWLQETVRQDKIKFEQSVSQAELATQELLDDGQGTYDVLQDGGSGVERGVRNPQVSLLVSCTHTLVGAGGTANGSRVDEKSGIRYQPQPEDRAAQQSPKMVESLTAQQSSVDAQQSHKTNKVVERLTAQQSSVDAQQSHKTNPSVGMVESLTARQSKMDHHEDELRAAGQHQPEAHPHCDPSWTAGQQDS